MTRKGKHERNWKYAEIKILIVLYEERVCLWDIGNEEYMNQDRREVAYQQIDEEMKKLDINSEVVGKERTNFQETAKRKHQLSWQRGPLN